MRHCVLPSRASPLLLFFVPGPASGACRPGMLLRCFLPPSSPFVFLFSPRFRAPSAARRPPPSPTTPLMALSAAGGPLKARRLRRIELGCADVHAKCRGVSAWPSAAAIRRHISGPAPPACDSQKCFPAPGRPVAGGSQVSRHAAGPAGDAPWWYAYLFCNTGPLKLLVELGVGLSRRICMIDHQSTTLGSSTFDRLVPLGRPCCKAGASRRISYPGLEWHDAAYRETVRAMLWTRSDPTRSRPGSSLMGRPVARWEGPIQQVCTACTLRRISCRTRNVGIPSKTLSSGPVCPWRGTRSAYLVGDG